MIGGGCHCGAVRYEATAEIEGVIHCHCKTCRKINGTVYGSSGILPATAFRLVAGQDVLTPYESSPGKNRWFCSQCGSHIYAQSQANPDNVVLRIGTIDGDPGIRSRQHIWMSHKPAWYEVNDDLPHFDQFPG